MRPPTFDDMQAQGKAIAGTPETVAESLREKLSGAGADLLVGQFAFGDLTVPEILESIELFVADVMPRVAARTHGAR